MRADETRTAGDENQSWIAHTLLAVLRRGRWREIAERLDVIAAAVVGPAVELGRVFQLLAAAAIDGQERQGRSGSEVRSPQSFSNWATGKTSSWPCPQRRLTSLMVT